eukprot:CAMPEP_0119307042 /NCGR_PEP_ID=MMETSP1333-20130426/7646_1 /TAXON_ID=418940 /ORGANISM="Scyphosphaera apsteinii, Strain RCC1455" /LENGTH=1079 /DNA_ID=CAMNT_0007310509 /DNA_START=20 /DNA_END=3259 /DNA_ORIENTATION=-
MSTGRSKRMIDEDDKEANPICSSVLDRISSFVVSAMPPLVYQLVTFSGWWIVLWMLPLLGDTILPEGAGFALLLLYISSRTAGFVVKLLSPRLPPLLGMLLAGLLLRNIHAAPLSHEVPLLGHSFEWWSLTLRMMALALIMLRAGLGLDLDKLRAMGAITAKLACFPCLAEAASVCLLSGPFLGLPIAWGGLLGFVIAAVSPAVVVPGMLDLQARKYGTNKGIPSMVVAAASFDDVLAIAGFSVCLAIALPSGSSHAHHPLNADTSSVFEAAEHMSKPFATTALGTRVAWLLIKAPIELIGGVLAGILIGLGVGGLPFHGVGTLLHSIAVIGAGLLCVFGGRTVDFGGGGVLATVVLGCVASRCWGAKLRQPVQAHVNSLWNLAQPMLFGLLGSSVNLRVIEEDQLRGGVGLLVCAILVRLIVTRLVTIPCMMPYFCVRPASSSSLTATEAKFVCIAWLPKATVQAAVGSMALDKVMELGLEQVQEERAKLVLTLSVLVILMTAPLGAIGIAIAGPKLLTHDEEEVGPPASEVTIISVDSSSSQPQLDPTPTTNTATGEVVKRALISVDEASRISNHDRENGNTELGANRTVNGSDEATRIGADPLVITQTGDAIASDLSVSRWGTADAAIGLILSAQVGTMIRYGLTVFSMRSIYDFDAGSPLYPGLLANIVGCFLFGLLSDGTTAAHLLGAPTVHKHHTGQSANQVAEGTISADMMKEQSPTNMVSMSSVLLQEEALAVMPGIGSNFGMVLLILRIGLCSSITSLSQWNQAMVRLITVGAWRGAFLGYFLGAALIWLAIDLGQRASLFFYLNSSEADVSRISSRARAVAIFCQAHIRSLRCSAIAVLLLSSLLQGVALLLPGRFLGFTSESTTLHQLCMGLLTVPFGVLLRWWLSRFNAWSIKDLDFPLGTFLANVLGCAVCGFVLAMVDDKDGDLTTDIPDKLESVEVLSYDVSRALGLGFCSTLTTGALFAAEVVERFKTKLRDDLTDVTNGKTMHSIKSFTGTNEEGHKRKVPAHTCSCTAGLMYLFMTLGACCFSAIGTYTTIHNCDEKNSWCHTRENAVWLAMWGFNANKTA